MTLSKKATTGCAPSKRGIKPKKKTAWDPENREQLCRSKTAFSAS